MKKLSYLLLLLVGFFLTTLPAFAAEETVADHAGLFTEQEIQKLNEEASAECKNQRRSVYSNNEQQHGRYRVVY